MSTMHIAVNPWRGGPTAFYLRDPIRRAEAVILPERGFNCVQYITAPEAGTEPVEVIVSPGDPAELGPHPFHAGIPLLFPFPNRVRGGRFEFEGRQYFMEGLLNKGYDKGAGQAIHGLVADRAWDGVTADAPGNSASVSCTFALHDDPEIASQFPFPCTLKAEYTLSAGKLTLRATVTNVGDGNMPFGFGIHPWFPVSLHPAGAAGAPPREHDGGRARTRFRLPATAYWELDHLMPTGRVLPTADLDPPLAPGEWTKLGASFYDNVFTGIQHDSDGWSSAAVRDPASDLEVVIAADAGFREWVMYAPLDRDVVALEPYTCTTDAVNLEPRGVDAGLRVLGPGESWSGSISFSLEWSRPNPLRA